MTGGTQDNGTWTNLDGCNNKTWTQVIYGDGGNAGYDATNADVALQRVHGRVQRLELP